MRARTSLFKHIWEGQAKMYRYMRNVEAERRVASGESVKGDDPFAIDVRQSRSRSPAPGGISKQRFSLLGSFGDIDIFRL